MTGTVHEIRLPWPHKDVRSNSRAHWGTKAKAAAKHRKWAKAAAQAAKVPRIEKAIILIEYWPQAYREDIQNVSASCKPYIDGIADAMGCDDRKFRVDFPSVWAGKRKPGEMVFRICQPVVNVPIVGTVRPDGRVIK